MIDNGASVLAQRNPKGLRALMSVRGNSVRRKWESPITVPLNEKIHRTVLRRGTGVGGRGNPPDREGSHHDTGRTHEPAHRGQLRWASEVSMGRVTICSHRVVDGLVEEPRVERQSSGCTTRGLLMSPHISIPEEPSPSLGCIHIGSEQDTSDPTWNVPRVA